MGPNHMSPRRPDGTQKGSLILEKGVVTYHSAFASNMSMAQTNIPDAVDAWLRCANCGYVGKAQGP